MLLLLDDLRARGIKFTNKHLRELEKRGKFPRRRYLGPKTPAWDSEEIEAHERGLPVGSAPRPSQLVAGKAA